MFSKNVPVDLQQCLAEHLGMVIVAKHEKYLGLPTYVGRKKTATFSYIKESLSKKLEGWQGKLLSSAGKDLLIRVVAQALPSYAMSCFLLPKQFCDTLHQMCANFWWGSKSENKKIHWMSWKCLCQPKEVGGMGFRDLYAHNLALLAKQGWRLLCNPSSLLARLYRAKYYPSGIFGLLVCLLRPLIVGVGFWKLGKFSKKAFVGRWGMDNPFIYGMILGFRDLMLSVLSSDKHMLQY